MTKTRKLTATTPLGTFTRTTARDYSFVTVSLGRDRDALYAEFEAERQQYLKDADTWRERARQGGWTDHWGPRGQYSHAFSADQCLEIVDSCEQRATRSFQDTSTDATIWGWSSRRDLAEKVASQWASRGYQQIMICPVDAS